MPIYRTPGVYFEWLDAAGPGIVPLRTDIAGFVGIAARGPVHSPRKVASWTQFVSLFGDHSPQGLLAYAVEGFFANGGDQCYVVRVVDPQEARPGSIVLVDRAEWPLLQLTAANQGTWAQNMDMVAIPAARNRFTLILRAKDGTREIWPNLSVWKDDPRYAVPVLEDKVSGSKLVRAAEASGYPGSTIAKLEVGGGVGRMKGGADGLWSLRPEHLSGTGGPTDNPWGLAALESIDEVSIVAIPDVMIVPAIPMQRTRKPEVKCEQTEADAVEVLVLKAPKETEATTTIELAPSFTADEIALLQRDLVAHCEKLRDRVAILDPAPTDVTAELALERREQFETAFAALYYPWLRVADPLRLDGLLRSVPPSGHLAGIYARGDLRVGVHKPPANEEIELAQDVTDRLDEYAHAELNDGAVNAIRVYPGRGIRVMGARTLSRDPAWRFINVRRLLLMIEEAIEEQTQWASFEPNNETLWRDLERAARGFLTDLWRRGMLDGTRAEQAFEVTCDATTNPPEETDLGRMTCLIGLQPPLPAEFVIVRLGKSERGTEIVEARGVGYA